MTRLAAALLALLLASPLLATVWTRASTRTRIAKGGSVPLEDVSYAGRDWSAAITAVIRPVATAVITTSLPLRTY